MFYLTFFKFVIEHLLFEKLMISQDFFILLFFLMKFLFFFEEFFKLCILEIGSDNFIVEDSNLFVVLLNIFLDDINLLIDHF